MLFGIVATVSVLGAIVLAIGLLVQKGRDSVDLTPRSLLRMYLYVASLAGVVVLAGGLSALIAFGLSGPLGRDVIYGPVQTISMPPCPVGAVDCKPGDVTEQNRRAAAERERKASEDLIRGISFTVLGAIFFSAHWIARRTMGTDEGRSLLKRGYLMLGTLSFGLATIFMLPSGVTTAASNALIAVGTDVYRQGAGDELAGGLVALVIWLIYLRLAVRDFRAE